MNRTRTKKNQIFYPEVSEEEDQEMDDTTTAVVQKQTPAELSPPAEITEELHPDDIPVEELTSTGAARRQVRSEAGLHTSDLPKAYKYLKDHPLHQRIGNIEGRRYF